MSKHGLIRAGQVAIFIVVATIVIVVVATTHRPSKSNPVKKAMEATGNSFIAPIGATKSIEDTWTVNPDVYTKGWNAKGTIDAACAAWKDDFRNWIGAQNVGSVSGEVIANQSCSYTGPKDGSVVTMLVAIYGTDPQPSATLTITRP